MSVQEYVFHEQWFIPAQAADVYRVLCDAALLPQWWRGVYLSLIPLGEYDGPKVGHRYQAVARGFLPYKLRFVLETAILDPDRQVGVRMEGDLIGTWTANLFQEPNGTRVQLEQHCRSDKRLIKWFSPLAKPPRRGVRQALRNTWQMSEVSGRRSLARNFLIAGRSSELISPLCVCDKVASPGKPDRPNPH